MRNHRICNYVYQIEKTKSRVTIIFQINDPRMHRLVSDDANYIQRLLDMRIQTFLNKTCDVVVNGFTFFSKAFTQLLDAKTQKSGGSAWRRINNLARLIEVTDDVFWQILVRLRPIFDNREYEAIINPHRDLPAVEALAQM